MISNARRACGDTASSNAARQIRGSENLKVGIERVKTAMSASLNAGVCSR